MAQIKLLILFTMLFLAGCFSEEGGGAPGGGLFAGHKPADNITTIVPPANNTYVQGNTLNFKVTHPLNMTVSGSPLINFDIGGTPVQATYVSGNGSKSLNFSYTVQAGENDSDGIDFTSLDFNDGDITFTHAGGTESISTTVDAPNTSSVLVDTDGPEVVIIAPPGNDTYLVNQELNFLATFDQTVNVTGTPSLELNIGGNTINAKYVSGSGTTSLSFRYIVQSTDFDNNGIQMNSPLVLSGGALNDVNGNAAVLNYAPTPMPSVNVDGDRPWAQTITYPADVAYTPGQHLDFTLEFTEQVNVTNMPRLSIDVGGVTKFANYLSGSGTDTLIFRYTVVSGDVDNDGIELQNLIDLNTTGTIQDLTAVNADLNLETVLTPGIIINGILPEVDTITPPVNGTYKLGDVIYFNLNFNTNVDVTGFPILDMELDSSSPASVDILYNAGSGTDSLVMRYVVQNGDLDEDGITLVSPLDLNGGTIQDINLTNANLDITTAIAALDTSSIFIDGVPPTVTSITPPADDDYEAGQDLDFILNFNEPVDVVGGVPSIDLDIGSNVTATYVSGTGTNALTFRYTVQIGDQDFDGVELLANDISLNGATLEDAATNSAILDISGVIPNTPGVTIDGIIPEITSIDVPTFQYYNETDVLQFTVNISEAVDVTIATPRIAIDIGGTTVYADYVSGGGTTALLFEYTVVVDREDHDGITLTSPLDANGAIIEDSYGNDLDLDFSGVMPDSSGVLIDSLIPTVSTVTPPADDTYADTENLDFIINFNEAVDVAGGTPFIEIDIDGVTRQAQYDSGTGTNALTFRYTIVTDEEDLDGIAFVGNNINLNGATIQDVGGNDITLDMTVNSALPSLAAVNVEAIHPTITGVTPPADTTYIIGDDLDFVVQFDENVDVTNIPRIEITLNSGTVYADYLSGTGTQNITYRYTVAASEEDLDGISLVSPLDLNTTGTLNDQWGNTAELTYTPPVTTAVLVDGVIPTVTIDTYPNIDFTNEATYTFSGSCSENGELVNLDIGGLADTPTCTALAWSSTIDTSTLAESADNTVADISITADHADASGNDAVQATQMIIKDSIIPTVGSNSINAQTYIIGDNMQIIINYNEVVTVSGTPKIAVTLDTQASTPIYATYTGGSGSSILSFEYTIQDGDEDNNGTDINASIDASVGSIVDNLNNETDYALVSTNFAGAIVDGIRPEISAVNIPSNTYYANDNILVTLTFNDNVTIAGGSPTIPLSFETNVGGPAAVYSSGSTTNSIIFDYPVIAGNEDTNGIDLSSGIVNLGGATIQDVNGNEAVLTIPTTNFPSVLVDAIVPEVTITGPLANINATNETSYTIDGTCSENGEIVTINIGGVSATPTCTALAWSTTMDLNAVTESADNTIADVAITADHQDAGGSSAVQATDSIIKDSILPTVSSNSIAAGTSAIGDTVSVSVLFNEVVNVSDTPRIELNFETEAAGPVYAIYTGGDGTNTLTFEYTVVAGDEDTNGIVNVGSIDPNSGSIDDNLNNTSDYVLANTANATSFVDGIAPQLTAVNITANTYYATETLTIDVTFDDNITVGGPPEIPLTFETTSGTPTAVYNSGDGTSTISFDYLVAAGNEDTNGIDLAAAISLAGGSLQDVNGNDAALTLSTTNFPAVLIDAIIPTVAITSPADSTYINIASDSATFPVSGTCSEAGQTVTIKVDGVNATSPVGMLCDGANFTGTIDTTGLAEGVRAFTAEITDGGGQTGTSTTNNVTKDTVAPTIAISNPADSTFINSTTDSASFTVDGTCDESGATVSIEVDASAATSPSGFACDGTNFTGTIDTTGLAQGARAFTAIITDAAGNSTTSSTNTITKDTVAPNIALTTPADATFILAGDDSATYAVSGTCDESGQTVNIQVDAVDATSQVGFSCDGTNFSGTIETTGLAEGVRAFIAIISDVAGNSTTTAANNVTKDTVPPAVAITVPADSSYINIANDSATFTVSGTCNESGQTVDIRVDGTSAAGQVGFVCDGTNFTGTINSTGIAQGALVLTAYLEDAGGNNVTSTGINLTKDTIAPNVAMTTPADTTIIGAGDDSATYTVSGTCDENTVTVAIEVDGSAATGQNGFVCDGTNFSGTIDTTGYGDATYAWTAVLTDAAGNSTTSATNNITKDTAPPTVAITTPTDSSYINIANDSATFTVSGTCNESGQTVNIQADGVDATSQSGFVCDGTNFTGTIDTTGLAQGVRAFTAQLSDAGGNTGTSATNNVTKDTFAPSVAITTPADATIIGAGDDSATYAVSGTCDENGVTVAIEVDGVAAAGQVGMGCNGTSFSGTINTTGYADATYAWTAVIIDAAGNETTSATNNITKDATPPAVAIVTPANSSFINMANDSATFAVSGTCDESGQTVLVKVDSVPATSPVGFVCDGTNFTGTIDTTGLAQGTRAFTAELTDSGANTGTSASNNVVKDTIAPLLAITSSPDITSANHTSYSLSGTCNENSGTVNVNVGVTSTTATCDGTNWSVTGLDVSSNSESPSLSVTADLDDAAGNSATQASTTVVKDATAPLVAITTPADASQITVATDSTTFAVNGTCNESGQTVTINIDGSPATSQVGFSCDGTNFSGTIDTTVLAANNTYAFTAELSDTLGNTGVSTANNVTKVQYSVAITSAPAINIANETNYVMTGTCSVDTDTVTVTVGGTATNSPTCTGGSFTTSGFDVSGVTDNATVSVVVDHGTASDSTNVLKDTVAPTLTMGAAADITATNVSSYSLSGTCDEAGGTVNINLGTISTTAPCNGTNWSVTGWNTSAQTDGTGISVTADLSDVAGNPAVQQTDTVDKDATAPTVTLTTPTNNSFINITNDNASFAVTGTCDDATATFTLKIDGATNGSVTCDGANITGSFDSTALSEAAHTIIIEASDAVGNTGTSATHNFTRDVTAPSISSITPPVDGVKLTNDVLSFTVNYNENVTVTGSPTLTQTYNTGGGNAVYASGGGTSALVFNYTVLVTDFDDDGITLVSPLALAGGTMTDTAGNNAILTFTPPTTTGVTVNNVHPVFEYYDGAALITTYDYGDPNANVTVTITVRNVGTAATTAGFGFQVSNGGGVFTIQVDNCSRNIIPINGDCTIDVQYKDKNPVGLKTGSITASDNGYGTDPGFVLNLEGTR